jgi:hypothetical protein
MSVERRSLMPTIDRSGTYRLGNRSVKRRGDLPTATITALDGMGQWARK